MHVIHNILHTPLQCIAAAVYKLRCEERKTLVRENSAIIKPSSDTLRQNKQPKRDTAYPAAEIDHRRRAVHLYRNGGLCGVGGCGAERVLQHQLCLVLSIVVVHVSKHAGRYNRNGKRVSDGGHTNKQNK